MMYEAMETVSSAGRSREVEEFDIHISGGDRQKKHHQLARMRARELPRVQSKEQDEDRGHEEHQAQHVSEAVLGHHAAEEPRGRRFRKAQRIEESDGEADERRRHDQNPPLPPAALHRDEVQEQDRHHGEDHHDLRREVFEAGDGVEALHVYPPIIL
jgi:hypothetical protein